MKNVITQFLAYVDQSVSQRNLRLLRLYLLGFLGTIAIYSVVFHLLMLREGQNHTWFTGVYWTLTVMSTLGFGDITFHTDLGRLFSMIVLMTGTIFLLVILPFTFIEFFYAPWIRAREEARAPKRLRENVRGHVIMTHYDPVTAALINRLKQYGIPYVLLVANIEEALKLHDLGINVVVGEPDSPDTYERVSIDKASLLVATGTDTQNTNIAFTVRELAKTVTIIATASDADSVDILQFAGASHVVRLANLMGQWLARRTIAGDAEAHIIGKFDELLIAEATGAGTPLVGKTIGETNLRQMVGVSIVGVWERGKFEPTTSRTIIGPSTVLVMAGSQEQLNMYDQMFCIYHRADAPVVIIGGGRVGRSIARALAQRNVDFRIIERLSERICREFEGKYVSGNAADLHVLEEAGIREAPALIVTSHEDDMNIYLTIYCRKLRPDIEIISRSTEERNVSTLHRAGADFVMSYASMGANIMFNLLRREDLLMVAEGLDVFRVKTPEELVGKPINQSRVREDTKCTIVAVSQNGKLATNPEPDCILEKGQTMVLIGSAEAENSFFEKFVDSKEEE